MSNNGLTRREYGKLVGGAGMAGLTGLAGCSGNAPNNQNAQNDSNGTTTPSESSKPVEIWSGTWGPSDLPDFTNYVEENVDAPIQWSQIRYDQIKQKYLVGAETGTPDVTEGNPSVKTAFAKADLLEPIGERLQQLEYSDGYIGMDSVKYKGETLAIPRVGNGRGLVYRKDIFEKYGWDLPKDWNEFMRIASEITKNEDEMYGFTLTTKKGNGRIPQEFLAMLFQRVDNVFALEDGTWRLQATPEDLGIVFKNYYWDPFFKHDPPASDPAERGIGSLEHDIAYVNGNYASLQTGPWIPGVAKTSGSVGENGMKNYRRSAPDHNPLMDGGSQDTFREILVAMLNPHTDNMKDSWDALATACSPKALRLTMKQQPGNIPAHEEVQWPVPENTNNPEWAKFADIMKSGTAYGFWNVTKTFPPLQNLVQKVVYDQIDPMKAGQQLHSEWKSLEGSL